jgi:hypothetical protein
VQLEVSPKFIEISRQYKLQDIVSQRALHDSTLSVSFVFFFPESVVAKDVSSDSSWIIPL